MIFSPLTGIIFNMQSKSQLFSVLSTLLAAVILLFSISTPAVAAPACGLVPYHARDKIGTGIPTNSPSTGNGSLVDVVATGWYAGWLGNQLPPSQVPWDKYSSLTFAFA